MATAGRKAEDGILTPVLKTAAGLHKAGLVDKATMRAFDAMLRAGRAVDARRNPRAARTGAGVATRIRPLSQGPEGRGQQVGTRREAAGWAIAQAAQSGEDEGSEVDRLKLAILSVPPCSCQLRNRRSDQGSRQKAGLRQRSCPTSPYSRATGRQPCRGSATA
jgi:hypothetical protein